MVCLECKRKAAWWNFVEQFWDIHQRVEGAVELEEWDEAIDLVKRFDVWMAKMVSDLDIECADDTVVAEAFRKRELLVSYLWVLVPKELQEELIG
jgi:hypothetical protein